MTQQSVVTQDQIARIAELYIGYFNRAPEAAGLNYWVQEFARLQANGLTEDEAIQQVSSNFYDAGVKYGLYSVAMTPEEFVLAAYKNVLGRDLTIEPEADREEAIKAWVPALESGEVSREQFIATLIDTAKDYADDPTWGWVAEYLEIRDALALEFAKPQYSGGLSEADAIRKGIDALKFTSPEAVKNGQTVEQALAAFQKVGGDFSLVVAEEPEPEPEPDPLAGDNLVDVDAPLSQSLDGKEGFDTLNIKVTSAADAADLVPSGVTVQNFEVVNVDQSAAKLSGSLDASVFGDAVQQVWQIGNATDIINVGESQAAGFRNVSGNAETVKVGFTGATGTVALDKASSAEFIIVDQQTASDVALTKVAFVGATGGYLNLGSSADAIGDLGGQLGLPSDPTLSGKLNGVLTNVVTKVEDTLGTVGSNLQNSNSLVGQVLGGVIVGVNGVLGHVTDLLGGLGGSGGLLNQLTGGRVGSGPVATLIGNAVHGLGTVASNLGQMVTSLVSGITGTVGNLSSSLQNSNSVLLKIVGNITGTVNGLVSHLNGILGDLTSGTTSAGDVLGNLKQGVEAGVKGLLDHTLSLTQNVADHFQDSTGVLGQLVGGIATTASGLLARLDDMLSSDSGTAPVEHHPALPDSVSELNLALTDATDIRVYDGATLSHVKVLDASASTGDIKLHLEMVPSAALQTLKLGSGNDQVTMSTATLDASALKVDLGAGDDRIVTLLDNVADKAATPISLTLTGGNGHDTFAFIGGNISAADVTAKSFSNVVTISDFGNDTLALSYFTGFTDQGKVDSAIAKLGANATLFDAVKTVSALTKDGLFSGGIFNRGDDGTTESVHFVFKGDTYVYQDFDRNGLDSGDALIKLAGIVPVDGNVSAI